MNITTKTSWVGFLMALSALNAPIASAMTEIPQQASQIESRLTRITATLRERANQLPELSKSETDTEIAIGWADGRGGRGFVNTRRAGWGDGFRGGFGNVNPWRNGWSDRGGFFNQRWPDGGRFYNSW